MRLCFFSKLSPVLSLLCVCKFTVWEVVVPKTRTAIFTKSDVRLCVSFVRPCCRYAQATQRFPETTGSVPCLILGLYSHASLLRRISSSSTNKLTLRAFVSCYNVKPLACCPDATRTKASAVSNQPASPNSRSTQRIKRYIILPSARIPMECYLPMPS